MPQRGKRHEALIIGAAPRTLGREVLYIGIAYERIDAIQQARVLLAQALHPVAAVAEDVEVELRRVAPSSETVEQRA